VPVKDARRVEVMRGDVSSGTGAKNGIGFCLRLPGQSGDTSPLAGEGGC